MITCVCGLKYIGETGRSLKCRIREHVYEMNKRNSMAKPSCKYLYKHLRNCGRSFKVNILEVLKENNVTTRRSVEEKWIRDLKTVHPYGLNDKCAGLDPNKSVYNMFNKPSRGTHVRGKGKRSNPCVNFDPFAFTSQIMVNMKNNSVNTRKLITNKIWSLKVGHVKKVFAASQEFDDVSNILRVVQDLCLYKLETINKQKCQSKTDPFGYLRHKNKACMMVDFLSKDVDDITWQRIFKDKNILSKFPMDFNDVSRDSAAYIMQGSTMKSLMYCDYSCPTIYFKYDRAVGQRIMNYSKVSYLPYSNMDCSCLSDPNLSKYVNDHWGHVVTGNSDIISDRGLVDLLSRGPKYRVPVIEDYSSICESLTNNVNNYCIDLCLRKSKDFATLFPWRDAVVEYIVQYYYGKQRKQDMLGGRDRGSGDTCGIPKMAYRSLTAFHKSFVIAYVDKAAQNYSFICREAYHLAAMKELKSSTYTKVDAHEDLIVWKQQMDVLEKYGITDDGYFKLPRLVMIPKFHKDPVKFRPVVASCGAVTETVSKRLSVLLKFIFLKLQRYYNSIENRSGVKMFWTILNSKPVLDLVKSKMGNRSFSSVATYDFSTLYTTIEHQDLITSLKDLVNRSFHGVDEMKIVIDKSKCARWVRDDHPARPGCEIYDRSRIFSMISWLVNNTYFIFQGLTYRQTIGIPMGTSCAPFMANLYLMYYETKFLTENLRVNFPLCRKLKFAFRYIDDLLIFNDEGSFDDVYPRIYPASLTLNKTNITSNAATFLDIDIRISDFKISTNVYDKRRDFNFQVNVFPSIDSSVSTKMCYNVFCNEVKRYTSICTNLTDAQYNTKRLILYLLPKGYEKIKLINLAKSILGYFNVDI